MTKAKTKILIGLMMLSSSLVTSAQTNKELLDRIESLEKRLAAYEKSAAPSQPSAPEQEYNSAAIPEEDIDASYLDTSNIKSGWWENTSLGGYGELHLNTGDRDQIDFHRWVLFINHRFNDRIKFFSELEVEHSVTGGSQPGAVELEQAYIEFALDQGWDIKVGQYLVPVGLLNETHEPETFFGVERNNVEVNIIPTTWWEAGLAATKRFDIGLSFDLAFHSALNVSTDPSDSNAFRIRSGRQQVAEADATEWATTARVKYNGSRGINLSAFANYQSDISTDNAENNAALLLGGTLVYQKGGFGLKALIAHWDINGASYAANDADTQWGYYIEPSYVWKLGGDHRLGVFGRYSHYQFARGVRNARGGEFDEYTFGLNYWPVDNVVLKADYTLIEENDGDQNETLNLGVGYSF